MFGFLKKFIPKRFRKSHVTVPVVVLQGVITPESSRFQSSLNLAGVAEQLEDAFSMKEAPAVALVINSPGGSPVQSRLIFQRIRSLAEEHKKSVLVFVEDVAASGGYMIALAGDEIIVDPTSVVGSIGVVSSGFGFTELIGKIGVERRIYTSGENKVILDPFRPERQEDVEFVLDLQRDVHEVFIAMVKERRAGKLADHPDLFSGLFWTGRRGVELGLVDRMGSLREVLRERYGEKTELEMVEERRSFFGRRLPAILARPPRAEAIAGAAAHGLAGAVEERSLWARYGL